MTLIIPTASTVLDKTIRLLTGDQYILTQGLTLSGDIATLIESANSESLVDVAVYGSIFHSGSNTILLMATSAGVTVGSTGVIQCFGIEAALRFGSVGSVNNLGLISAAGIGVAFDGASGGVTNSGTIRGGLSGIVSTGDVQVINSGTITGQDHGVTLGSASTVLNSGDITSKTNAVDLGDFSQLQNSGTIVSTGPTVASAAVTADAWAYIDNSGTITGQFGGISTGANATITNSGVISSMTPGYAAISVAGGHITNSGTILGDLLLGNIGAFFMDAGGTVSGNIVSGSGQDRFYVNGADLFIADYGVDDADKVYASVDWQLTQGLEELYLIRTAVVGIGNTSNNMLYGNGSGNLLSGLTGDDALYGQSGLDSLFGGDGNDLLSGGEDDDVLTGGALNDRLSGDAGNDLLRGASGDDSLAGDLEDDTLYGGAGNDTLNGGDGADVIYGGTGRDGLTGGQDADVFVFAKGDSGVTTASRDTILDFDVSKDMIDLSRFDANTTNANPDDGFTFINFAAFTNVAGQLRVQTSGANLRMEADTNGDGLADFQLALTGNIPITIGNLIL